MEGTAVALLLDWSIGFVCVSRNRVIHEDPALHDCCVHVPWLGKLLARHGWLFACCWAK